MNSRSSLDLDLKSRSRYRSRSKCTYCKGVPKKVLELQLPRPKYPAQSPSSQVQRPDIEDQMFFANMMASSLSRHITHHRVLWRCESTVDYILTHVPFLQSFHTHNTERGRGRIDASCVRACVLCVEARVRSRVGTVPITHSVVSLPPSLPLISLVTNSRASFILLHPRPDMTGRAGPERQDTMSEVREYCPN